MLCLASPMFGLEVVNDPWLDEEESYTCKMVSATVDEDIREEKRHLDGGSAGPEL